MKNLIKMFFICGLFFSSFSGADDTTIYTGIDTDQCSVNTESYRFILIMDNSGSMSSTEFTQSKGTMDAVSTAVLTDPDLGDVEVAIVQYGTNHDTQEHKYNVTVPFTSDVATSTNWSRHYGTGTSNPRDFQDHLPASLARMRDENVYAAGGALDLKDATNVQYVFFTDAWRNFNNSCCSELVGGARLSRGVDETNNGNFNTDPGFGEFNRLKNGSVLINNAGVGINGQFTVLNTNTDSSAQQAAAAIASPGGSWNGGVEENDGDPEGSQTKPRRFIQGSFSQTDTTQLVNLVKQVIKEIQTVTFTQVAPAIAVNAFNELTHRDELYYSVFDPRPSPRWEGNIKKFNIALNATETGIEIQDQNNNPAIDPDTGGISRDALSDWSQGPFSECGNGDDQLDGCTNTTDGTEVTVGAFRQQLTNNRKIVTNATAFDSGSQIGVRTIQPDSDINPALLGVTGGVPVTTTNTVDLPFSVTGGRGTETSGLGDIFYTPRQFTNRFSARAKSDTLAAHGIDPGEPYAITFTREGGRAHATFGLETVDPGLNSISDTRFNIDFGLYFIRDGRLQVIRNGSAYRLLNGGFTTPYSDDDQFSIEIDGAKYQVFQNGIEIANGTDLFTAATDFFLESATFERTSFSAEHILTDIKIVQTAITTVATGELTSEEILSWMIGVDTFNDDEDGSSVDSNNFVADGLHSRPAVIDYGNDVNNPVDVLFHTTNLGMLHAINGQTGDEIWAYVPEDKLINASQYIADDATITEHVYGLDGPMTTWVEREFIQTGSSVEARLNRAYLYFGERRGGRNYHAINATNISGATIASSANLCSTPGDSACILFTIQGGITDGFNSLGQTWARPVQTKVNTSCTTSSATVPTVCQTKDVIILSGGYDTRYDDPNETISNLAGNVLGNHIYMVDATTGDIVWSAGKVDPGVVGDQFLRCDNNNAGNGAHQCHNAMEHSIVAEPQIADIDGDGAIDLLFAIDVAGNVWRFDFRTAATDKSGELVITSSSGGIVANLAETGAERRFYNRLEAVAVLKGDRVLVDGVEKTAAKTSINLIVGSGSRVNPLLQETSTNRFYVVYDDNLLQPDFDTSGKVNYKYVNNRSRVINGSDLNVVSDALPLDPLGAHQFGFYVPLPDTLGYEKIINRTLTENFLVLGVGYTPATSSAAATEACGLGNSTLYTFNLLGGVIEQTISLRSPGLPSPPVKVIVPGPDGSISTVCVGTECITESDDEGCVPSDGVICNENKPEGVRKTSWWEENRDN